MKKYFCDIDPEDLNDLNDIDLSEESDLFESGKGD